jgi:site-specific recombinase XerD
VLPSIPSDGQTGSWPLRRADRYWETLVLYRMRACGKLRVNEYSARGRTKKAGILVSGLVSGELLFRQPADQNVTMRYISIENLPPSHFARDKSPPQWHGWHAFRRGLATNLHALGVDDKTIQAILRHSNVSLTQNI